MVAADTACRYAHLAGRSMLTGLVRRLPPPIVAPLRRPLPVAPRSLRGRGRAVLLGALRRGGIPRAVTAFSLPDNPELSFFSTESLVLQQLYWFGENGWEPEMLPWWRHFCRASSAILELGANVGYYAVQGARVAPHAHYVAVEPHPASVYVCRANLALNRIESVQVIAAAAVADPQVASVELRVPWEQLWTPTVAFVSAGSELPPRMARRSASTVQVPAVGIRTLLAGIDLLKLDVEGQEHALLAAGREHLTRHQPTIFVEVLPGTPRLRALLVELCERYGYRCYSPRPDRLVPVPVDRIATVAPQHQCGGYDMILSAADVPMSVTDLAAG